MAIPYNNGVIVPRQFVTQMFHIHITSLEICPYKSNTLTNSPNMKPRKRKCEAMESKVVHLRTMSGQCEPHGEIHVSHVRPV